MHKLQLSSELDELVLLLSGLNEVVDCMHMQMFTLKWTQKKCIM